jgi:hypothetical protein
MEDLFKIAGEEFYFDLDRISDFIKLEKQEDDLEEIFKDSSSPLESKKEDEEEDEGSDVSIHEETMGQMIDLTKWELTKAMIDVVLSEHGEVDEKMGLKKLETQLSIPFRISFNTLLINKIIKKNG